MNIVKIKLQPLNFNIYLKIINNKIYWVDSCLRGNDGSHCNDEIVDLEITLTPSSIIKSKIYGFEKCVKNKDIKISGDMTVAMELRDILESFDLDIETKLANIFGDFFAVQFSSTMRGLNKKQQDMRESFEQDFKEFLEDELQIIVTREEVDEFVNSVDELRFAIDRLEAKYKNKYASSN